MLHGVAKIRFSQGFARLCTPAARIASSDLSLAPKKALDTVLAPEA